MPGVSGSVLAMGLGVYERLIDAVTNFFKRPKENIKYLSKFGLGVFIAIIFFSKFILFLLNNYYKEAMYLFLGLILGTLIPFLKEVKYTKKNIIIMGITLGLVLSLSFYKGKMVLNFTGITYFIYIALLGFIDALSSIVPGVSGTAIFMMLNSYEVVLNIMANPFNLKFIIYILGVVIGVILVCLLMDYLFKRKKEEVYSGILGLMVSSLIVLFISVSKDFKLGYLIYLILGIGVSYNLKT